MIRVSKKTVWKYETKSDFGSIPSILRCFERFENEAKD